LENQRLPQRVRLFKFLEGDLHRQIKLLDRPRRKDNRELRLYSSCGQQLQFFRFHDASLVYPARDTPKHPAGCIGVSRVGGWL